MTATCIYISNMYELIKMVISFEMTNKRGEQNW